MSMSKKDGLITVLIERLVDIRIPRILDIKEKVENGNTLNDVDIQFFNHVLYDFKQNQHLLNENEELQKLAAQFIHFNNSITTMALENEKKLNNII